MLNLAKVKRLLTYKAKWFFTGVSPACQLFNLWILVLNSVNWKIAILVFFNWFFSTFIKLIRIIDIFFSYLLFSFFNWCIKEHFLHLLSSLFEGSIIFFRRRRVLGLIILWLIFSLLWSCWSIFIRLWFFLKMWRLREWLFLLAKIEAYMLLLFLLLVFI